MPGWWRRHGSETAGARGREEIGLSSPTPTLQAAGQSDLFHIRVMRAIRWKSREARRDLSSEPGQREDGSFGHEEECRFDRRWYKEGRDTSRRFGRRRCGPDVAVDA
jgi:hypothetical protein